MQEVDYLIVGQGISGSCLAWYLHKEKKSFLVVDNQIANTASKIASGVINPITGRRFVRTWMIEDLMPFAVNAYKEMEQYFNCQLIQQKNIINFHTTPQMQLAFEQRQPTEQEFLSTTINVDIFKDYFNYNFGVGMIQPCWWINVPLLLQHFKSWLTNINSFWQHQFDDNMLQVSEDGIVYNDIKAKKIIFCDGINTTNNKYFKNLPFALNKGEAILFSVKDKLPEEFIFKQGLTISPWQNNTYWVGSNYEWNFTDDKPTDLFKQKVTSTLNFWLKQPYQIQEHLTSIRPANVERRPFVGFHPTHKNIGILNGMGSKGCSLAPYFADELVNNIVHGTLLHELADVKRFDKILQRFI